MKESKIEWTHSTFNPWWGCTEVSPGCDNCYARTFAKRVGQAVWGKDAGRRFFGEKHWNEPLRWNAEAAKSGEPWRVFCASMADVFEDYHGPEAERLNADRERLFRLVESTPALTWLLLTKRPQSMNRLAPERWRDGWPVNAWAGCTVEDRAHLSRIHALRSVPARTRWLSIEPLIEDLGEVDFAGVAWAIIGGESGAHVRPFNVAWARSLIRQSRAQGVAPHVKQLGAEVRWNGNGVSFPVHTRVEESTAELAHAFRVVLANGKGSDMAEWPEDLRVREYPAEVRA